MTAMPNATHAIYRWNHSPYHVFAYTDKCPTTAICGAIFPLDDASQEYWHHFVRLTGHLADMQAFIAANPLWSMRSCPTCQGLPVTSLVQSNGA